LSQRLVQMQSELKSIFAEWPQYRLWPKRQHRQLLHLPGLGWPPCVPVNTEPPARTGRLLGDHFGTTRYARCWTSARLRTSCSPHRAI